MTEEKPASLADVLKNIERDPPKTAGEKKETDVVNIVDEIERNKDERDRIDSLYNICMECHGLDFCRMKYKWYREGMESYQRKKLVVFFCFKNRDLLKKLL